MKPSLLSQFLEVVLPTPRNCLFCQKAIDQFGLCQACAVKYQDKASRNGQCQRCGSFGVRGQACDVCRHWPRHLVQVRAVWPYEEDAREAILAYKYHQRPWMAKGLARASIAYLPAGVEVLVPVPLHASRLRERGYNQSALLAKALSEAGGPPVVEALRRTKATPHQVGLSKAARRHNLDGAIAVARPKDIAGKHVCLVDDVITTGSTLEHCAQALHTAGAKAVSALVLAAGFTTLAGR